MKILVMNIGSTSLKYRLLQMPEGTELTRGHVERIGEPGGDCPDYGGAITRCRTEIAGPGRPLEDLRDLSGIGFKAVHGGPLSGARVVDDDVLAAMEEFAFLAPAHNPPYVAAMRAFRRLVPEVPLVALFETAFFDQVDEAAVTYAVPHSWKTELGIRRYGFHGASHRAASEKAQELLETRELRHISCHLGGSSSVAAIRNGVAVDCSFGMSPQSGLPHNNRTGDIDVFAVLHVMKRKGYSVDEVAEILATRSGLAGLSGGSGDVRDLSKAAADGDARSRLALEVFVDAIRRYLGSFLVRLGGLDVLTFSGGIGENSPDVRAAVCERLSDLGIELDPERNQKAETTLSRDSSPVKILLVPADEEGIVARATAETVAELDR
jgi:acetate kinase